MDEDRREPARSAVVGEPGPVSSAVRRELGGRCLGRSCTTRGTRALGARPVRCSGGWTTSARCGCGPARTRFPPWRPDPVGSTLCGAVARSRFSTWRAGSGTGASSRRSALGRRRRGPPARRSAPLGPGDVQPRDRPVRALLPDRAGAPGPSSRRRPSSPSTRADRADGPRSTVGPSAPSWSARPRGADRRRADERRPLPRTTSRAFDPPGTSGSSRSERSTRDFHNGRSALLLRVRPGVADTDVDRQRGVERVRADHLLADEVADGARLDLGHLEQQLVVHLQDEPGRSALGAAAARGCAPSPP